VVDRCPQLDHFPSCITQLLHLRTLSMYGSNDNVLTLYRFKLHLDMDGDGCWCSLEEIGPMFQLRKLILHGLQNVPVGSTAGMSMISRKEHLDYLELN